MESCAIYKLARPICQLMDWPGQFVNCTAQSANYQEICCELCQPIGNSIRTRCPHWNSDYRKGANRSPGPVFFHGLLCWGLYLRGVSIRDRALLIHRFSTAFKAPIMVCVIENTSMHFQLYQEKPPVTCIMCKIR